MRWSLNRDIIEQLRDKSEYQNAAPGFCIMFDAANEIERLRAEVARSSERAAHGWQPIETATKDGSRTLIAWLTIKNEWRFSFAKWDPSIEHYCLEDRDAMVGARYWMPLPAPDAVSSSVTEKSDG